jgi:cell division ATPase MinD
LSRIIGILSGKGGVGKTTFASNLGIALNRLGKKTVIVDCNITNPHLSHYLGVKNYATTLNDVLKGKTNVKDAPLSYNNIFFIPASENLSDIIKVDIQNLKKCVHKLSEDKEFDFILLDSAPGIGREALSVLKACNEIIFVTTPVIPNILDITRCGEVANKLGHNKFHIVLNMIRQKDYELKIQDSEFVFTMPILGYIPFDENVMDSTAVGIPMLWYKPDSVVSNSFMDMASNLAGVQAQIVTTKQESFIGKIFSTIRGLIPI